MNLILRFIISWLQPKHHGFVARIIFSRIQIFLRYLPVASATGNEAIMPARTLVPDKQALRELKKNKLLDLYNIKS
ncbi:MAG TPA: hypothetical protein PLQ06_06670 [Bacteroidales bacterium]|nr:hypothetical protein [Bacteroidales bacterium]